MNPFLVAATISWLAAAAMSVYVGLRRDKQTFHWLLFGLSLSLVLWLTGSVVRQTLPTEAGLRIGVHLVFAGVLTAPPLWLMLAAHYAQARFLTTRPAPPLLIALPSFLFFLALLTNDGHRLMLREFSLASFEQGPAAFAGPVYWVFIAWAFGCVLLGAGLYVASVWRLPPGAERRRAVLLALGAVVSPASSLVYLFQLVPARADTTPFGLTLTLVLFYVAMFRYRLLESLPLAREDVLRQLEDGVLVADAAGSVGAQNPAALRILHAQEGELRGRPLAEAIARLAATGAPALPRREAPGARGEGIEPVEFETAEGRCIEVSGGVMRDSGGDVLGRFALLRDRTEERRYERRMRQIQKLETVGALAAGIAGEVNDPLAFVRSNLGEIERLGACVELEDFSRSGALLAAELRDLKTLAEEARAGVDRISRLVGDMSRLFRGSESGFEAVDLSAVVEEAVQSGGLDRRGGPLVVISEQGRLLPVRGSVQRLSQAVGALLDNARQALASASEPLIRIALRRDDGWIELEVSDNGPGVPEHLRERVFDPFFTTKSPDQGTGLGLSLAFDIAREHGGVLEERSVRGRGATFVLRLPLSEPERAA